MSVWFYESVIMYIVAIVLSAVALQNATQRATLWSPFSCPSRPLTSVLAVLEDGRWYWLFMPPTLDPSVFGDVWYIPCSLCVWF